MNKTKYLLIFISIHIVFGAYLKNIPTTLTQPDGEVFNCLASGDEFYHYLHTEDDYTIIQNREDGYFYYAIKSNEKLIPSIYKVNSIIPSNIGIEKKLMIPFDEYKKRRDSFLKNIPKRDDAPSIGTINNINVFIRFEDEEEFTNPRSYYDPSFNKQDGPSLNHYFKEVSYDLLTVDTYHYPESEPDINLSYQDEYPRSYYQIYNPATNQLGYQNEEGCEDTWSCEGWIREQRLLKNAIDFIANEVPDNLIIDSNDDNFVDSVTFLIKGVPDGWAELLWPHRWFLFLENAYIHGKQVGDYNFNLADDSYAFSVGTLCHEFFHTLGAPDLYHYEDTGEPVAVGGWDLMDASSTTPQYMSAYMKYKYTDWITELPIIEQNGTYELNPLSNPNQNIYRINSTESDEYFVLEYRVKEGLYDINTPGSDDGLLIYRVNPNYFGNANGPPDELYLYRQGGTLDSNGLFSEAVFSNLNGRDIFNNDTNPNCFLSDGSLASIDIFNIGIPGETIQFDIGDFSLIPGFSNIIYDTDGDGLINPGEEVILDLSILNSSDYNSENIVAHISSLNENIIIQNSTIVFDNISSMNSLNENLTINISDNLNELPDDVMIDIEMQADYIKNEEIMSYNSNFNLSINVNLNQLGFPYYNPVQVRSSPVAVDLDNDGNNEIVFADFIGNIRIIKDGIELDNDSFPFQDGNQVWGSISSADIDLDGFQDFVVSTRSGYLYIFDINGLKANYDADNLLFATPVIGNIDDDPQLEIVIGGYQSSASSLFAVNPNGSPVSGFPYVVGEKIKSGVALADLDDNGIDDIVFGTDSDNLYALLDNLTIAPGFPFTADDKFSFSPVIVEEQDKMIIIIPSEDGSTYGILSDGSLHFEILSSDVESSVSINNYQNNTAFFLNVNGQINGYDLDGELIYNGPYIENDSHFGSLIFSDLDGNGIAEIVFSDYQGNIYVYSLDNSMNPKYIINNNTIWSHLSIFDIDNDGDMEIIGGISNGLIAKDIKTLGSNSNYWNTYQGNLRRTGFYDSGFCLIAGDLDNSSSLNVIDLIIFINIILEVVDSGIYEACHIDFNDDGKINIFDLIILIEIILNA